MEIFGNAEDDDVDCLFYIYARFLTDRQEGKLQSKCTCALYHASSLHTGVLCITSTQSELSEVHGRLMAQNVSLHALLESTHQTSPSPLPC